MQAGDRAEPDSPSDALGHYQQSETQFQEALELKPGHSKAEKGLREVEPKLARLRDKMAKQAESANQPGQPHQPAQSLQNLLGQVNERERDTDAERQPATRPQGHQFAEALPRLVIGAGPTRVS